MEQQSNRIRYVINKIALPGYKDLAEVVLYRDVLNNGKLSPRVYAEDVRTHKKIYLD